MKTSSPFRHFGLAQIDVIPGHPDRNLATILATIHQAREAGLALVAFPEMAVPGYFVGDEWENERFIEDCLAINEEIRQASQDLTVVWGSVDADPARRGDDGRLRKYNAAFIAGDGQWLDNGVLPGRSYKTLLPAYREFEDKRHFWSLDRWAAERGMAIQDASRPFQVPLPPAVGELPRTLPLGLMLCEDMWDADYALKPGRLLAANGAQALLNLSCSPWTLGKNDKRHRVAAELIAATGIPLAYVNNAGIQNNGKDIYAFDGGSTFYLTPEAVAEDQDTAAPPIRVGLPPFAEGLLTTAEGLATDETPAANAADDFDPRFVPETLASLLFVIRKWFAGNGNPPAAIGLSGGIDSALVATLLALAIGPDRVWAVNMPSRFNSDTTKNAARQLAVNLGIRYAVIPIQDSVEHSYAQVENSAWSDGSKLVLSGLNRENIQARDRGGRILAAVASAIGGVFTNNGNKTETGFGYATLYGDVNGALAPIGDLYKTQVYAISRHVNDLFASGKLVEAATGSPIAAFAAAAGDSLIPRAILDVVPSAELSANQNVDEGKGDPIRYDYHDRLLCQFVDGGHQAGYLPAWGRRDPYDLLRWYLDGELDRRLELPQGTTAGYCPDLACFCRDLEEKWLWYKRSIFKRIQAPPIIALSRRAFGFDLRESTNGVYLSRRYRDLRDGVLPPRSQG